MSEVPERRVCLACKGQRFRYDYTKLKFTSDRCKCCEDGTLPVESGDDGYGPLKIVQHYLTTEVVRDRRVVGSTTDIYGPYKMPDGQVTLKMNGLFTVDELLGLVSLVSRLKQVDKFVNCDCCRHYDRREEE